MRRSVTCAVLLLILALPASGFAQGWNNLKAGTNGILTAPLDPILMVITPPDDFEEMRAHQVTGRILALPTGVAMGAYRLLMGAFDVVFTPAWVFPTLSPSPRVELIPGIETG